MRIYYTRFYPIRQAILGKKTKKYEKKVPFHESGARTYAFLRTLQHVQSPRLNCYSVFPVFVSIFDRICFLLYHRDLHDLVLDDLDRHWFVSGFALDTE